MTQTPITQLPGFHAGMSADERIALVAAHTTRTPSGPAVYRLTYRGEPEGIQIARRALPGFVSASIGGTTTSHLDSADTHWTAWTNVPAWHPAREGEDTGRHTVVEARRTPTPEVQVRTGHVARHALHQGTGFGGRTVSLLPLRSALMVDTEGMALLSMDHRY